MADYLEGLYGDAEAALKASLGERTLADLHREVAARLAAAGVPCERAPAPRARPRDPRLAPPAGAAARRATTRTASPGPRRVRARAAP